MTTTSNLNLIHSYQNTLRLLLNMIKLLSELREEIEKLLLAENEIMSFLKLLFQIYYHHSDVR